MNSNEVIIIEFIKKRGIIRARDLKNIGIHHDYLRRMVKRKTVKKETDGVYTLFNEAGSLNTNLAIVASKSPKGVIGLISALYFHNLGTQVPDGVHLLLPKSIKPPKIIYPKIVPFHVTGRSYTEGIGIYDIGGVAVKITTPAKTIADCFKFRNIIGTRTPHEALKEYMRKGRGDFSELIKYAEYCRIKKYLLPILESYTV